MATVTVLKPFRDFAERCDRVEGETFEATEERARQIDAKLPGYIAYVINEEVDLSKMTVAQLRGLAEDRGVNLPVGAKKAEIIDALTRE